MGKRILQLISSAGFFGAENVLLELSCALADSGLELTIGVLKNAHNPNLELEGKCRERGLDTHVFECGGKFDIRAVRKISSYIRSNSVEIVHSHGYKANIYAVLANMPRPKARLVATCHNWIDSNAKMGFYSRLDRFFLRRFDAVVAVSKSVEDIIINAGLDGRKTRFVENGINISRFTCSGGASELKRKLGIPEGPKVIGTVGRLSAEKGHTYLLKAAKAILEQGFDCYFLIVGEGPLRQALMDEAGSLGIADRVVFAGKRDDIPEMLSIMDVFMLPSLIEGQPMSLFEAMASEKPIVATDVGDVRKILCDGRLGFISAPRDAASNASGVILYLKDFERARNTGRLARREAVQKYSSSRMANDYIRIYDALA